MPITIHWEKRGVRLEVSGLLTGSDLIESNQAIYSPEVNIDYQILDLTLCEGFDIDADELHAALRQDVAAQGRETDHRMAYVAPPELIRGMKSSVRAFSSWVGLKAQMGSFETLKEAREWAIDNSTLPE